MAPSPFQLMRKRWKLSTFLVGTAGSSIAYFYDYSITSNLMRYGCSRAAVLGDAKLNNPNAQTRHITVILNPVAGKRKSKKLYTKWVEPLLHLAGIKVSVIETESPNQAYDLMKIMSNCDGVAIVGGDGTVHEALNGLLHRSDASKAVKDFPIAIMPTGQYNSIARYIHQSMEYRNQKEFLIQSTLRLINNTTEKHDVLKITPLINNQEHDNESLPIYALRDIRYGKYQDYFVKTAGFMLYQVYLRPYWMRLQRVLNSGNKYPKPQIDSISYTKPCIGCSRCFEKHRLQDPKSAIAPLQEASANRRWWSMLAPVSKQSSGLGEEEKRELELSKRDNPSCDKWVKVARIESVTDVRACMMGDKQVRLSMGLDGEFTASEVMETQDIKLKLSSTLDGQYEEENRKKKLESLEKGQQLEPLNDQTSESDANEANAGAAANEKEKSVETNRKDGDDNTVKFLIDGQSTRAHSIEVTSLHKVVTIFTGQLEIF